LSELSVERRKVLVLILFPDPKFLSELRAIERRKVWN